MNKFIGALALLTGMSLAACVARAEDEDVKKAQKDVLDLAKDLEAGKDVAAKAKAIKKKYEDLNTVMHAYKPSEKGGIGVGPKGKADGIELKLTNLARGKLGPTTTLNAANLAKEKDDLIKMAYINMAIARIAHEYAPAKPKGGKGAKEWKGFADEQEKASKDLIEAIKKGDLGAFKKAATNLNSACNNCHSDFRD
jgi:hypothetical protein